MNEANKRKLSQILWWLIAIAFIFLILTPLWSYLIWYYQDPTITKILILDKTVPKEVRDEHKSFNWILSHEKYFTIDSSEYQSDKNYLGFFPDKKTMTYRISDFDDYTELEIDKISDSIDFAYYTDTYGVFYNDWYEVISKTEQSRKIYGGATENDYYLFEKLKSKNKLVIAEFNLFASPTSSRVRKKFEKLLGINWSGWTGRYFESLDTLRNEELPDWAVNLYMEQHKNNWPFSRPGIVLVHHGGEIAILESDTHLLEDVPYVVTGEKAVKYYGMAESVHYPFWFEISFPDSTNTVVSYFELEVNELGDSILRRHRIPEKFPAVIAHKDKNSPHYYFAGDFADNPISLATKHFAGIQSINYFYYLLDSKSEREEFFWEFYVPLITKILDDNYSGPNNTKSY